MAEYIHSDMYIINAARTAIHNARYIQRFLMQEKEDAIIIVSSTNREEKTDVLGRYFTKNEAKEVFEKLFCALMNGDKYFEMPVSLKLAVMERKRDARQKRRGGS